MKKRVENGRRPNGEEMIKLQKLVDVHTHLEQYAHKTLGSILKRAEGDGVRRIVTSGMDLDTSVLAVEIAGSHRNVLASVGIHPWMAADGVPEDRYDKLKEIIRKTAVVAVGEIGLDFVDNVFRGISFRGNEQLCKAQILAFETQVELACELRLPMIVHSRGAKPALIEILRNKRAHRAGGVIHNFDGNEKEASTLLDMGFFLSIGGAVTFPEATGVREVSSRLPLDGMLTETDSPYMPLYGQSTAQNEPSNVLQVVKVLSALRGIKEEKVAEAVYSNFLALFPPRENEKKKGAVLNRSETSRSGL
ncbi:MAG: TatD family hydrolase [Spirochaetes bacterium]|nr:TatD family hydrolase [Spirochaetota bacterium]